MTVICNEEGKIDDLPYNCTILGEDFMGEILFVGIKEDVFDDCPADEQAMRTLFPQLWGAVQIGEKGNEEQRKQI